MRRRTNEVMPPPRLLQSAADRASSRSQFTPDSVFCRQYPFVGVDTVRVKGSLRSLPPIEMWDKVASKNLGGHLVPSSGVLFLGNGVAVVADFPSATATIELSVPRVLTGDNLTAASLDDTKAVLAE